MAKRECEGPQNSSVPTARLLHTALRFVVSGVVNTTATLALYWLLLLFMSYHWAYLTSFCAGIVLSYALNTRFVFKVGHDWRKLSLYPLIYLITYGLGALALHVSVNTFLVHESLAPFIAISATLPVSFALNKLLLQPRTQNA